MNEPIDQLKKQFAAHDIDGYIIPINDEYMNEYVPSYAKRLEYICAFTGSNGLLIVLKDKNLFFTDGRYSAQAKKELDSKLYTIYDLKNLKDFNWSDYISQEAQIGYDPNLFTNISITPFASLKLVAITINLVDQVWHAQPPCPTAKAYIYPEKYAGLAHHTKIEQSRYQIQHHKASAALITALDSICWLLNIRGGDIEYCPLLLSRLFLTLDSVYLFTDLNKLDDAFKAARADINYLDLSEFNDFIKAYPNSVLVDLCTCSIAIHRLIKHAIDVNDIVALPKACKNDLEIKHAVEVHSKDAVALIEMLASIYSHANIEQLNENDIVDQLTIHRSKQDAYVMDSFATICAFASNGAIIHYNSKHSTPKYFSGQNLLLIDSGGQYLGGTTDVTRTIAIGEPTDMQKQRYTDVLKGHIAIASVKFPIGTAGANLEVLARAQLWSHTCDYAHSTGHGVGNFLNVHEGPQALSPNNQVVLKEGMIISNEPGYYLQGQFGIRIENLIYVKETNINNFLEFEQLTLVPYAKELILIDELTKTEKQYLLDYYKNIENSIGNKLSKKAQSWLGEQVAFVHNNCQY